MLDQSYSTKSLVQYQRKILMKGMTQRKRVELIATLPQISKEIDLRTFTFESLESFQFQGKQIWRNKRSVEQLILRYTNHILKKIYKVKQANRNSITDNIASLLSSGQSFSIIKTDIKSFFESIDINVVLEELHNTNILSQQAKYIIGEVHRKIGYPDFGLPRGVCFSPTLAELRMRKFDAGIKKDSSVFYYARYVDDIVIFCTSQNNFDEEKIKSKLPTELQLNERKTIQINISCHCKINCTCIGDCKCLRRCKCVQETKTIEYLGYQYSFSDLPPKNNHKKEVQIEIAKSKVNKIKTRIIFSFLDFYKYRNFQVLKKQIEFLSSNYKVYESIDDSSLMAGIYYSYPLITTTEQLSKLDEFLRKTIFSKKGAFGKKMNSSLSNQQKLELSKYSFKSGFEIRRKVKFTPDEIAFIKKSWSKI